MISEFDLLSDKISKLVLLAQSLRQQNAELRQQIEALSADKASLTARINEAHDRVAAVLEQLPAPEPEVEQPEEPHDEEVA
jgi:cell division septum initiation protein DivIVA